MLPMDYAFFKNKKVLLTGHTGFKGSWMCRLLLNMGVEIIGYSTCNERSPSLFHLAELDKHVRSIKGDVRDFEKLQKVFDEIHPEIVIHMAAQPIVRRSYEQPRYTYETNVMGTVNIMECVRLASGVQSVLNVTTDKVYLNHEWVWGYREDDALDGFDPYSNSKSCSELVTHSYYNSYFAKSPTAVSTVRAGNVIGGGDFANDRIIPDCVRSVCNETPIIVRNPNSVRPFQHVLEAITAYLTIVARQARDKNFEGWYNVGPEESSCVTTSELVRLFCLKWGDKASWAVHPEANAVHEANFLKLDCSTFKNRFGWKPRWEIEEAVAKTCEWTRVWLSGGSISEEMDREIRCYLN